MKSCAFVFLFIFCYAECRKAYVPIDKNANLAFINMESGGVGPAGRPPAAAPAQPPNAASTPTKPNSPPPSPVKPVPSSPVPNQKPVAAPAPVTPAPTPKPAVPATQPPQIKPKPVNPVPVANPITTPGPGSVKQLVNFYDSQGKASPIRPYSYSQAVKQG